MDIEEYIAYKGYKTFMGGSRRFGWDNSFSDYDLFVLGDLTLEKFLGSIGTASLSRELYELDTVKYDIGRWDINVFVDEMAFTKAKEEHDQVETFLKDKNLVPGIRLVRLMTDTLNTKILYKTLLRMSNRE